MNTRYLLRRLLFVVCCCAAFAAAGCDGMVSVDGWIVETSPEGASDITMSEKEVDQPKAGTIGNAWVELWTADGDRLIDRMEPGIREDGYFHVMEVGLYERGMRYLIKAGAPGYQTVNEVVKLQKCGGDHALITLAPVNP